MQRLKLAVIVSLLSFTAPSEAPPSAEVLLPTTEILAKYEGPPEPSPSPSAAEKREIKCLADNVFYEAGIEPDKGKVAVAMVTLNRAASGHYPDNVCDVVQQRRRGVCQFSWWCNSRLRHEAQQAGNKVKSSDRYKESYRIAMDVFTNRNKYRDNTHGALYYHEEKSRPVWRRKLLQTAQIGRHIFYTQVTNNEESG